MPIERVTMPLLTVVATLLERPATQHHGYAIAKRTGLAGGTVQQILSRLEAEGWLQSHREDIDPHDVGRRPRRLYEFTGDGVKSADQLMLAHGHRLRRAAELGRLAPEAPAVVVGWLRYWIPSGRIRPELTA